MCTPHTRGALHQSAPSARSSFTQQHVCRRPACCGIATAQRSPWVRENAGRTKRSVTQALYLRLTHTPALCERSHAARCQKNRSPPCPRSALHSRRFPGPLGRRTTAPHAALLCARSPARTPRRPHRALQNRARYTERGPIPPATVRLVNPPPRSRKVPARTS